MANEKQLSIEVRGKVATLKSQNFTLVGGNNDYDVVFDFDEHWAKHNVKTALFVFGKNAVHKVFEGNICNGVAIDNSTVCYIGVFAGDIVTTTPAEVEGVLTSITDIGGTPRDPEPSVYNQIIELLNKYIEQGGSGSGGSGADGFSPTVEITPIKGGHRVTVTDINGKQSFDVMDGTDGENGKDGFSPKLSATITADGKYLIEVDEGEGFRELCTIENGKDGEDGKDYILTEADKADITNLVLANFTDVSEVGQ